MDVLVDRNRNSVRGSETKVALGFTFTSRSVSTSTCRRRS
jgi:hypothetical protein